MKFKDVIKIASMDRLKDYKLYEKNFIKQYNIDFIIKLLFVFINSFGFRKKISLIFIDEINNSSMSENLNNTIEEFRAKNDFATINFYKCSAVNHIKIGLLTPLILLLLFLIQLFFISVIALFNKSRYQKISLAIIAFNYYIYLLLLPISDNCKIVLMSDHHFFGSLTVLFMKGKIISFVIQHGAICDIKYYYPIYADYFLAWGTSSKLKLFNDPKVICTGTYKFKNIKEDSKKENIAESVKELKILWPLRPIADNILLEQLKLIINALNTLNIKNIQLIIKKHPSTYSNFAFLKKYSNNFSKIKIISVDKHLSEIEFDIAIIDNSTIGYDLIIKNKPFIVLDYRINDEINIGYEKYGIKKVNNFEDLSSSLRSFLNNRINFMSSYEKARNAFLASELNNNKCTIVEVINNF